MPENVLQQHGSQLHRLLEERQLRNEVDIFNIRKNGLAN